MDFLGTLFYTPLDNVMYWEETFSTISIFLLICVIFATLIYFFSKYKRNSEKRKIWVFAIGIPLLTSIIIFLFVAFLTDYELPILDVLLVALSYFLSGFILMYVFLFLVSLIPHPKCINKKYFVRKTLTLNILK